MLTDFTGADRVYIACGYTDLRRGIDGLAALVQQQFHLDPFTNTLFLFCGRRRDRIKALYWEGDGFVLLYKRLESGSFQWPRNESEARALTPQQYRWLMEGLSVDQPKAHKRVSGLEIEGLSVPRPYDQPLRRRFLRHSEELRCCRAVCRHQRGRGQGYDRQGDEGVCRYAAGCRVRRTNR